MTMEVDAGAGAVALPRTRRHLGSLLRLVLAGSAVVAAVGVSGLVRPNLAVAGWEHGRETGWALDGVGEIDYVVMNRGWTEATVGSVDPGIAGVEVTESSFRPIEGAADAVDLAVTTVVVRPGDGVLVHLRFAYDCDERGRTEHLTAQARGALPLWLAVDLRSGGSGGAPGLAELVDFACTPSR